jgi:hypothetical protein
MEGANLWLFKLTASEGLEQVAGSEVWKRGANGGDTGCSGLPERCPFNLADWYDAPSARALRAAVAEYL